MSAADAIGGAARALVFLCALLPAGGLCAGELPVVVETPAGERLAEAVVFAVPIGSQAAPRAGERRAVIDQVNKRFVPRVSIVQTGTAVDFPNSDNIRHSVYSFSPAKTFTLKLYSGKPANPLVFDSPGIVALGCNIHDRMIAWLVVVDTPYFAVTGADGRATLAGLPAGSYDLTAWHPAREGAPAVRRVELDATPAAHRFVLEVDRVLAQELAGDVGSAGGGAGR